MSKLAHQAVLNLVSMAFRELSEAASDSGVDALNELFNEGGIGYEASSAVREVLPEPITQEITIELAIALLRSVNHPLASVYEAVEAGQLKTCIHSHRHGVDAFMVRASHDQDVGEALTAHDSDRFELHLESEFLDVVTAGYSDLQPLDLRDIEVDATEEESD